MTGPLTQEGSVEASQIAATGLTGPGEGVSGSPRARRRRSEPPEHPTKIECVDCAKRPPLPDGVAIINKREFRPRALRKIDPRSLESHKTQPRCQEDWLAWRNAQRAKAAAGRSRKRSGLDDETRRAVRTLQSDRCPCGAPLVPLSGKRLEPDADHCHELALTHDHPEEVACEECFRGFLCRHCNREVIGFFTRGGRCDTAEVIASLRGLADYLEDWPMRRYLRSRTDVPA